MVCYDYEHQKGGVGMKQCHCGHHKLARVIPALSWISAILFFWASFTEGFVFGFDTQYYFETAILLVVLGMGMKSCGCCCEGGSCGKMVCGSCGPDEKR